MNPLTRGAAQRSISAMNAWEPITALDAPLRAEVFRVRRAGRPPPTPLVFASPHSGRVYPADMRAAATLDALSIRRSEDAFVDDLIDQAADLGVACITAEIARAYMDLNRDPLELDPGMFADELPAFARSRTARVAAGLGAIARVVSEGQEI
jgi:N-formylglutamate amidohydrolase